LVHCEQMTSVINCDYRERKNWCSKKIILICKIFPNSHLNLISSWKSQSHACLNTFILEWAPAIMLYCQWTELNKNSSSGYIMLPDITSHNTKRLDLFHRNNEKVPTPHWQAYVYVTVKSVQTHLLYEKTKYNQKNTYLILYWTWIKKLRKQTSHYRLHHYTCNNKYEIRTLKAYFTTIFTY
jgi:hypothetical protein